VMIIHSRCAWLAFVVLFAHIISTQANATHEEESDSLDLRHKLLRGGLKVAATKHTQHHWPAPPHIDPLPSIHGTPPTNYHTSTTHNSNQHPTTRNNTPQKTKHTRSNPSQQHSPVQQHSQPPQTPQHHPLLLLPHQQAHVAAGTKPHINHLASIHNFSRAMADLEADNTTADLLDAFTAGLGEAGTKLKASIRQITEDSKIEVEQILSEYNQLVAQLQMGGTDTGTALDKARDKTHKRVEQAVADSRKKIELIMREARHAMEVAYSSHKTQVREDEKKQAMARQQLVNEAMQQGDVAIQHAMLTGGDVGKLVAEKAKEKEEADQKMLSSRAEDLLDVCKQQGVDECPLLKYPPAPMSAHPYCDCDARVQQLEVQLTQFPDFYFNKFSSLRRCHGQLCYDCVAVLKAVFFDLGSKLPEDVDLWCTHNMPLNAHCTAFVRGFQLTSPGLHYLVSEKLGSPLVKVTLKQVIAFPPLMKLFVLGLLDDACTAMDCC